MRDCFRELSRIQTPPAAGMFFASFFSSTYHVPDSATPPTSPPAWRDRRTSAYPGGRAPTHTPPTRNPTPPLHLGGDPHTSDPPRHFHIGVPREFRESYLLRLPIEVPHFPYRWDPDFVPTSIEICPFISGPIIARTHTHFGISMAPCLPPLCLR